LWVVQLQFPGSEPSDIDFPFIAKAPRPLPRVSARRGSTSRLSTEVMPKDVDDSDINDLPPPSTQSIVLPTTVFDLELE
jgi:hypothetical protein